MEQKNNCKPVCDFEKKIFYNKEQPSGFKQWTEKIKYKKCRAYLPDGTITDIRTWLDFQGTFDSGSYTNFLLNIYKEL